MRSVSASRSRAGAHEQQRYDEGLRAWRRRVLPRVHRLIFPVFTACLIYLFLGPPNKFQFIAGLLAGGVFAVYLWVRDEPPAHVQRHREGAEGERATAKALEPLLSEGWRVAHNVDTGRGNRDHVLVGPGGVFLLDSKQLGGTITVEGDVLRVERVDDPRDSYELRRLGPALRGEARRLHDEIEQASNVRAWVSAVVVLWSPFAARVVEGDRVVFVHGEELAEWLRARPRRLDAPTVTCIFEHVA